MKVKRCLGRDVPLPKRKQCRGEMTGGREIGSARELPPAQLSLKQGDPQFHNESNRPSSRVQLRFVPTLGIRRLTVLSRLGYFTHGRLRSVLTLDFLHATSYVPFTKNPTLVYHLFWITPKFISHFRFVLKQETSSGASVKKAIDLYEER
jgi:hypothetical protein